MKGSRLDCPLFLGEGTPPVCLQSQTLGISRAVPLSSRKNAKGDEQAAQLAFGSDKCRLSINAFSREPRGSHAREIMRLSLEADRRLVVAALGKKVVWGEKRLAEANRCAGPAGRCGSAREWGGKVPGIYLDQVGWALRLRERVGA